MLPNWVSILRSTNSPPSTSFASVFDVGHKGSNSSILPVDSVIGWDSERSTSESNCDILVLAKTDKNAAVIRDRKFNSPCNYSGYHLLLIINRSLVCQKYSNAVSNIARAPSSVENHAVHNKHRVKRQQNW